MAPFALLPEPVGLAVLFVLSLAASVWTLRRLGLPWWWITWPPLVDNLWNGNPQLFLVPLLISGAAWFAPIVKVYAIVPLIIQLRLRAVLISVAIVLVTAPFLPWDLWIGRLSETSTLLSEQSQGGMSAWFFPVLVPFAAIALIAMGRQRASWWFIPALWPSTQWYYSLMAMPALTPLTAAILAAPVQGGPGRSGDRGRDRDLVAGTTETKDRVRPSAACHLKWIAASGTGKPANTSEGSAGATAIA